MTHYCVVLDLLYKCTIIYTGFYDDLYESLPLNYLLDSDSIQCAVPLALVIICGDAARHRGAFNLFIFHGTRRCSRRYIAPNIEIWGFNDIYDGFIKSMHAVCCNVLYSTATILYWFFLH